MQKMANLRRERANAWADMLAGSQQIPADRRCWELARGDLHFPLFYLLWSIYFLFTIQHLTFVHKYWDVEAHGIKMIEALV